jgi:hypothetical protein
MVAEAERGPIIPRVAFVGALAASFADRVRQHLAVPCEIELTDEAEIVSRLSETDVLVHRNSQDEGRCLRS